MDPTAEAAFTDFLKEWPTRAVVAKEIMTMDMRQEYRRAFESGYTAGKRSAALPEPGKPDGDGVR